MSTLIVMFILAVTIASVSNFWIKIILKEKGADISFMNTGFSEYYKFNKLIKDCQITKLSYRILFFCSLMSLIMVIIIFIAIVVKMINNLPT